jgi:hypothetical protein
MYAYHYPTVCKVCQPSYVGDALVRHCPPHFQELLDEHDRNLRERRKQLQRTATVCFLLAFAALMALLTSCASTPKYSYPVYVQCPNEHARWMAVEELVKRPECWQV